MHSSLPSMLPPPPPPPLFHLKDFYQFIQNYCQIMEFSFQEILPVDQIIPNPKKLPILRLVVVLSIVQKKKLSIVQNSCFLTQGWISGLIVNLER
jgi:hypothetical protein